MFKFSSIMKRLKGRLNNEASKVEGTFTMDNLQAVGQELAMIHNTVIEPIKDDVFLDTATGINLDRRAADFNEVRHPAQAAVGKILFKGTAKTYIPSGSTVRSETNLYITTEPAYISTGGEVLVAAKCQKTGSAGNTAAGTIKNMVPKLAGVAEATNPVAFEGGTDEETDSSFRARIYEKIRYPITSGNEYYYEYLAKQVPGIWKAKCTGCWNGPGTVKITLLGPDALPPDSTIIDAVRKYVETQRLIGADITYIGAVSLPITVSGNLILKPGYLLEDIVPGIRQEFEDYFLSIAFDRETTYFSYHKAIEMIFRVAGVSDIKELFINRDIKTVSIGSDEFCQLLEVNFRAN